MDEVERRARIKNGMAKAKLRGIALGNRTNLSEAQNIGREAWKRRVEIYHEAVFSYIKPWVDEGYSASRIARELNLHKIPTVRDWNAKQYGNKRWHHPDVLRLIRRFRND